eukprot:TRINITY_DN2966_c0_g1_i1.p1 TRINITY_DN2966_c0_g1~~TRINITY_DN2966_c0_g1_i1.p1  ORF type:complete len:147 (-),score=11.30 TRINITY_DN2966_c0_g1_i1:6-446(-)
MSTIIQVAILTLFFLALCSSKNPKSCSFTCPSGHKLIPKPNHKPSFNGCGITGMLVKSDFDFTNCCNEHDLCYDTCLPDRDKEACDSEFLECMNKVCRSSKLSQEVEKQCLGNAKLFFIGTTSFGCNSFMESRKMACLCDRGIDEL